MRMKGIQGFAMIGVMILLLILFQVEISHGAKRYEAGNFRVGKNVTVAAGETSVASI
jgi:hypothetical protein